MTEIIVRTFIRDYESIEKSSVRESYGVVVSLTGIICNTVLFLIKLIIGIMISSVAVMADSFNNLSDAGSSIITLIGFKMANKPADAEHPFGHGRIEYISAFIVSFIILLLGYEFLKTSVTKIFNPEEIVFNLISIVFLFFTIAVKIWLSVFNKKIGRKIDSPAMLATAQDSINDVFITTATVISIFVAYFTGFEIDGYAGVFVAIFLLYSGYSISKEVLSCLLGKPVSKEFAQKIIEHVESYDGITGTHDLVVHNYGPNYSMATIHAEVPSDVPILVSHRVIDRAEKEIGEALGIELVIHMDPVDIEDDRVSCVCNAVISYINEKNLPLEAHDFRIVDLEEDANVIFDLVVPYEYSNKQTESIKEEITIVIKNLNPNYRCIINAENGYIEP